MEHDFSLVEACGLFCSTACGTLSFPDGTSGEELACQCRRHKRLGFHPWVGKIPLRRAQQPTPVFLPGEPYRQKSLEGYDLWGSQRVWHNWSDLACTCGILVPWPGIKPMSPILEGRFLTTGTPGKSSNRSFMNIFEHEIWSVFLILFLVLPGKASSDSLLELSLWLAFHRFCCYNHT